MERSSHIDLGWLARRESEQVEWKENVADVTDVVKTIVAFANEEQVWALRGRLLREAHEMIDGRCP